MHSMDEWKCSNSKFNYNLPCGKHARNIYQNGIHWNSFFLPPNLFIVNRCICTQEISFKNFQVVSSTRALFIINELIQEISEKYPLVRFFPKEKKPDQIFSIFKYCFLNHLISISAYKVLPLVLHVCFLLRPQHLSHHFYTEATGRCSSTQHWWD